MAKRKKLLQSNSQSLLFEETVSAISGTTAVSTKVKAVRSAIDVNGLGLSAGIESFRDYIANGRANTTGWKPLPPVIGQTFLTNSVLVADKDSDDRDYHEKKLKWFTT